MPSPTVSQPSASQPSASNSQEHANVAGQQGDGIATNSAHNSAPRPNSTVATSAFQATEDVGPAAELRRELEDVRKENDELLKSVNDYKKKLSDMEFKNLEYLMDKKIRGEKIIYLEAEVAKLKQENVGLSNLVDDLNGKVVRSGKGSSKFVTKLSNSLDKEYITLATTVERMLLQWSQAEVLEIAQDQEEGVQRNWGGRVLAVKEFGLQLESPGIAMQGTLCVPMPFTAVLRSKDLFFIHSFPSYGAVLDGLVSKVLREPRWKSFSSPPQLSAEAINVISTNPVMISKVKQHLSDAVSNRKRLVRDEFFCILKYFSLKSTHDRRKQKPLFEKDEEITKAKTAILHYKTPGVLDYSRWRTARIEDLTSDSSVPEALTAENIRMDDIEEYEGEDSEACSSDHATVYGGVMRNELSFHLWTQFLGFDPFPNGDKQVATTFLSMTRLDAWIATVVQLLVNTERRGGKRQREFSDCFFNNFQSATYQFVSNIYNFVKHWHPNELQVPVPTDGDFKKASTSMNREATVILFYPIDNVYYLAVQSEWFGKYVSANMGTVHDCYIARFSDDWKEIIPLIRGENPVQPPESNGISGTYNDKDGSVKPAEYEEYDDDVDAELAPDVVDPLPTPRNAT